MIEGREQQRVEVERLHQEPKKIGHDTVVTEDHSSFAGKLDRGDRQEEQEGERVNHPEVLVWGGGTTQVFLSREVFYILSRQLQRRLTVERVQWLVSSLENRVASLMNTATAFRINVMKSWM